MRERLPEDVTAEFIGHSGSPALAVPVDSPVLHKARKALAEEWGGRVVSIGSSDALKIGEQVVAVQRLWKGLYNWPKFPADGSQWDKLFAHGERFKLGTLDVSVLFSPGHTLASITYVIGDAAFVHDTLFMPDSGTARADFPGGSAKVLWKSMQDILALPDETRVFTGHDYQPDGRQPRWESTVAEQKSYNPHIVDQTEASFIALRDARDATLPMPKLILHALQVNMAGGRLPEPEGNGKRYLKIPLDALEGAVW